MIEFIVFFAIGFGAFALFKYGFNFFKVFFGTNSLLKALEEKVQLLAYDFKVFKLRKEYAELHNLYYITPFEFRYFDDKFRIETEAMSQLDFLNKLNTLVQEIEYILSNMDERLKTTEPGLSYVNVFYSLKEQINEINPYVN